MAFAPLVVAGPSGVGKGTLLARLQARFPHAFGFSVSYTSRQPRAGEVEGRHYFFVTEERFRDLVRCDAFLEHASLYGDCYGTPRSEVRRVQGLGKICLLEVDIQGVMQIRESGIAANFVFIAPPSLDALRARLMSRKTETAERLERRVAVAVREIETAAAQNFFTQIVNDDVDRASAELEACVLAWYPHLR